MTLNAAQIGATHDVTVVAGHDLNVGVATDTYEAGQTQTKKKTGLQESGGSVMYGKTKASETASGSLPTFSEVNLTPFFDRQHRRQCHDGGR